MERVLIVKVTSLGDVVQTLPVVADIQRAFPGVKVDWAVDEAFATIVRWNAGVDRVLYAPLRRFKHGRRWRDLRDIAASIGELRAVRYDAVIDLHGVYKSAIISWLSRSGQRLGYHSAYLGERGAAFAYTGRFTRPEGNAWHGQRLSAGEALGYAVEGAAQYNLCVPREGRADAASPSPSSLPSFQQPSGQTFRQTAPREALNLALDFPDGGFDVVSQTLREALNPAPDCPDADGPVQSPAGRAPDIAPVALLFHATSKDEKKWPPGHWVELGCALVARGLEIHLPWGTPAERAVADEIAARINAAHAGGARAGCATVLPRVDIQTIAQRIEDAALVVGADTGLVHLAHALCRPTVMVFVSTSAVHSGVQMPGRSISVGAGSGYVPGVDEVMRAVETVYPAARGV